MKCRPKLSLASHWKSVLMVALAASFACTVAWAEPSQAETMSETHSPKRPNIIYILADDMGFADIGALNYGVAETPALDTLMREGTFLSQHYAGSAVCAPSRASLMTGRYPHRTGVPEMQYWCTLGLNEKTVADMLGEGGYATGMVGKWHLGKGDPRLDPGQRGFQDAAVLRKTSHWDWIIDDNGTIEEHDGRYGADVLTDKAIGFIEEHQDEPFFLYIAYFEPHVPLEAPEADVAIFREKGLSENLSLLYGMVHAMDRGIGRVLDTLDSLGLDENTLVIFASDNGPQFGPSWTDRESLTRYNAGLRGHKDLVYDGGVRVPGIVRWPAGIPGDGRILHPVFHFTDWAPTLLEIAGVEAPEDVAFDGASRLALLQGREEGELPEYRCWQFSRYAPTAQHNAAIRMGRWKLVRPTEDDVTNNVLGVVIPKGLAPVPDNWETIVAEERPYQPALPEPMQVELYDMQADPGETQNLAAEYPEVVAELSAKLDEWYASVLEDMYKAEIPEGAKRAM